VIAAWESDFTAWQMGAKFDAWQDQYQYNTWLACLRSLRNRPQFYIARTRPLDEVFPWDHISTGVTRKYLESEYKKSLTGEFTNDCREDCK